MARLVMWQAANVTNWPGLIIRSKTILTRLSLHAAVSSDVAFVNLFTSGICGRRTADRRCFRSRNVSGRGLPDGSRAAANRDRWARIMGALVAGRLFLLRRLGCGRRDARGCARHLLSICGVALLLWRDDTERWGFWHLPSSRGCLQSRTSLAARTACLIRAFIEKPRYEFQLLAFFRLIGTRCTADVAYRN